MSGHFFSQTPKYADQIFGKTPNMLTKFSETPENYVDTILIRSFKVSDWLRISRPQIITFYALKISDSKYVNLPSILGHHF